MHDDLWETVKNHKQKFKEKNKLIAQLKEELQRNKLKEELISGCIHVVSRVFPRIFF
jgi:hypothetical protein